jgi:hypothetical protein
MYTTDYIRYYKIGRPDGTERYVKIKRIYCFSHWRETEGEDDCELKFGCSAGTL